MSHSDEHCALLCSAPENDALYSHVVDKRVRSLVYPGLTSNGAREYLGKSSKDQMTLRTLSTKYARNKTEA
jgi:hypothetical protein